MSREEYIERLYEYTKNKNITIYAYYKQLATLCRKYKKFNLKGFEAQNPFLTSEDYEKLLSSSDELMPEFFARAMSKVITLNEKIIAESKQIKKADELGYETIKGLIDEEYQKIDALQNQKENTSLMVIPEKVTALVPVAQKKEEPRKGILSKDDIRKIIENGFYKDENKEPEMPKDILDQYARQIKGESTALAVIPEKQINQKPEVTEVNETTELSEKQPQQQPQPEVKGKESSILDRIIKRPTSTSKVASVLEKITRGYQPESSEEQRNLPVPVYPECKALIPVNGLQRTDIADSINQAMQNLAATEKQEEKPKKNGLFRFTSINFGIIEKLKGFALIRESKTGKADLYYHDPATRTLKGKTSADKIKADSGYYVNYQESIYKMINQIMKKYPNASEMKFIGEDGEEKSLTTITEEVFRTLREAGAIRFGNEYATAKINSFADLKGIKPGYGTFAHEKLKKGIYVRRDLLSAELKKYKLRLTLKAQEEQETTYKKIK